MRRAPILPLFLLAALVLAACGETSLSASQLRTQASGICTRAAAATSRIPVPRDPDQAGRFLHDGIAALRPASRALQRLKPPADLEESYRQAAGLNAKALALVERQARAIARGEDAATAFRALQTALDPVTRIEDSTWRALQVPACVSR